MPARWAVAADTTCRLPSALACRGQTCGVAQSAGPRSLLGGPPSCLPWSVPARVAGACSFIYAGQLCDSFLGSPSGGEVKRLHLVRLDLWVTAEVTVQTQGSLPPREKPSAQPGCEESCHLAWPGPMWLQAGGSGNGFSFLFPTPPTFLGDS